MFLKLQYFLKLVSFNVWFFFIISKLRVYLKLYDILESEKHAVSMLLETSSETEPVGETWL